MTIKEIKKAIFNSNAIIVSCKHRSIKGYWEYFLIYGSGKTIKIKGNRYKTVSRWLASRTRHINQNSLNLK